jgi:hypothetical protein
MAVTRTGRRAFLVGLAATIGGLAALGVAPSSVWSWLPFHRRWLDRRLTAALRRAVPGSDAGLADAAGRDWARSDALDRLVGDVSPLALELALADDASLRTWLGERERKDFRAGRTREWDGWILSETEVAVAVLLGG